MKLAVKLATFPTFTPAWNSSTGGTKQRKQVIQYTPVNSIHAFPQLANSSIIQYLRSFVRSYGIVSVRMSAYKFARIAVKLATFLDLLVWLQKPLQISYRKNLRHSVDL